MDPVRNTDFTAGPRFAAEAVSARSTIVCQPPVEACVGSPARPWSEPVSSKRTAEAASRADLILRLRLVMNTGVMGDSGGSWLHQQSGEERRHQAAPLSLAALSAD